MNPMVEEGKVKVLLVMVTKKSASSAPESVLSVRNDNGASCVVMLLGIHPFSHLHFPFAALTMNPMVDEGKVKVLLAMVTKKSASSAPESVLSVRNDNGASCCCGYIPFLTFLSLLFPFNSHTKQRSRSFFTSGDSKK
jgi:hypothetical protein